LSRSRSNPRNHQRYSDRAEQEACSKYQDKIESTGFGGRNKLLRLLFQHISTWCNSHTCRSADNSSDWHSQPKFDLRSFSHRLRESAQEPAFLAFQEGPIRSNCSMILRMSSGIPLAPAARKLAFVDRTLIGESELQRRNG